MVAAGNSKISEMRRRELTFVSNKRKMADVAHRNVEVEEISKINLRGKRVRAA